MRMVFGLVICATLTACATPRLDPVTAPPVEPLPSTIIPVALGELRGADALVFPDVDVPTAIAAIEGYAARCFTGQGLSRVSDPHGFSLVDGSGEPFLNITVASVSQSSALGLGGSGYTPAIKEAIADSVRGNPRCA